VRSFTKQNHSSSSVMTCSLRLQKRWTTLSKKYLPIEPENSIWRSSRKPLDHDPSQGWKIHVSSTILNASDILLAIGPKLQTLGVLFKAPISLEILMAINSGIVYGYSQVGKFITIYPRDELEFSNFVKMLEPLLTPWSSNPAVPFDIRFKRTCIYYRYGAFGSKPNSKPFGAVSSIVSPDGVELADARNAPLTHVSWLKDPFGASNPSKPRSNKLNRQYAIYRSLSQRGKGGVYECLDMRQKPPRKCILKEGRKNGETDWDGRDGKSRIQNEARVLKSLALSHAKIPCIYDRFGIGHNEYLVIERIDGVNLNLLVARSQKRLRLQASLKICLQLCEIVASIHSLGWLWRDCKLANFIIDMQGNITAIDFEGACRCECPSLLPWSTRPYMPPEITISNSPQSANRKHDLFSLGVCIFQILEEKILASHFKESSGKVTRRGVSKEIKSLLAQLLSPEPNTRPEAAFVAKALQQSVA
jgi:Protein kinase domain